MKHVDNLSYLGDCVRIVLQSLNLAILLMATQIIYAESSQPLSNHCIKGCVTPYGTELGKSPAGISAFSNCSSECLVFESNHLGTIYTGIKWQCVEFARRWLLAERGVVFGDVDIAAQIWKLDEVSNPVSKVILPFHSMGNGSKVRPQRGDLLIYGKEYLGTGHVAVIVDVNDQNKTLRVAEQNYSNRKWLKNYAREISFVIKDNKYWILDSFLIGWKRVGSSGNNN